MLNIPSFHFSTWRIYIAVFLCLHVKLFCNSVFFFCLSYVIIFSTYDLFWVFKILYSYISLLCFHANVVFAWVISTLNVFSNFFIFSVYLLQHFLQIVWVFLDLTRVLKNELKRKKNIQTYGFPGTKNNVCYGFFFSR